MELAASEIVQEIVDTILTKGWTQGMMFDRTGAVCLLGATACVGLENLGAFKYGAVVLDTIQKRTGPFVASWNDTEGRTVNDVLAMLHDCQIELKEMESAWSR